MNWSYTYHPDRDLITVRAEGELAVAELQTGALIITDIPQFHDGIRVLLDFSAVTRLVAQPGEMVALAVATRPSFSFRSKRAVVIAPGPMRRTFEEYATYAAVGSMQVFSDVESALAWLGLSGETARLVEGPVLPAGSGERVHGSGKAGAETTREGRSAASSPSVGESAG